VLVHRARRRNVWIIVVLSIAVVGHGGRNWRCLFWAECVFGESTSSFTRLRRARSWAAWPGVRAELQVLQTAAEREGPAQGRKFEGGRVHCVALYMRWPDCGGLPRLVRVYEITGREV
jgi:hypothetical protein